MNGSEIARLKVSSPKRLNRKLALIDVGLRDLSGGIKERVGG
jgi:hypothetical protein